MKVWRRGERCKKRRSVARKVNIVAKMLENVGNRGLAANG